MAYIALLDKNQRRREQLSLVLVTTGGYQVVTFSTLGLLLKADAHKPFSLILCSQYCMPASQLDNARVYYYAENNRIIAPAKDCQLKQNRLVYIPKHIAAFAEQVRFLLESIG